MKTLSWSGPVAVDEGWVIHFTFLCSCHRHSRVNVCSDFLKRKYLWRSPRCAECPQVVLRTSFWRGLSFCCHNSTAACSCGPLISSAFLQNQYHSPFCFLFFHQCDGLEIKGLYTWHGKFRRKDPIQSYHLPAPVGALNLKIGLPYLLPPLSQPFMCCISLKGICEGIIL